MPRWHSQVITTSKGFDLSNLKKEKSSPKPRHGQRREGTSEDQKKKHPRFGKKHPWQLSCNCIACNSWRFSLQKWHLGLHHPQSFSRCFSCTNQGSANDLLSRDDNTKKKRLTRPTNGEIKVTPASAHATACPKEKSKVRLQWISSSRSSSRAAWIPSQDDAILIRIRSFSIPTDLYKAMSCFA